MASPAYVRAMSAVSQLTGGRRVSQRWEFTRELNFSYQNGHEICLGSGRAKDLSESGIRFENDHYVPEGREIELHISWPIMLQNTCPLVLVIRGPLVRLDRHGAVVHIEYCEFQTCGSRSFDQIVENCNWSVVG